MSEFKYDLAVIGLGYVGLPLAIEAANNTLKVVGYDINSKRINNTLLFFMDINQPRNGYGNEKINF